MLFDTATLPDLPAEAARVLPEWDLPAVLIFKPPESAPSPSIPTSAPSATGLRRSARLSELTRRTKRQSHKRPPPRPLKRCTTIKRAVVPYTKAEKWLKILKYKAKKRRAAKQTLCRYPVRSEFARARPRVGGRFVSCIKA